jgi:hypothetical protein
MEVGVNPRVRRPAPTMVPLEGRFADVAVKLYARTRVWPGWCMWVVADAVPRVYVQRAFALRRELGFSSNDFVRAKRQPAPTGARTSGQLGFWGRLAAPRRGRRAA